MSLVQTKPSETLPSPVGPLPGRRARSQRGTAGARVGRTRHASLRPAPACGHHHRSPNTYLPRYRLTSPPPVAGQARAPWPSGQAHKSPGLTESLPRLCHLWLDRSGGACQALLLRLRSAPLFMPEASRAPEDTACLNKALSSRASARQADQEPWVMEGHRCPSSSLTG